MEKNKINRELEEIAPFLSNLKKDKKEGFSMPENYFDKFEHRLMHRIEEENALSANQNSDNSINVNFLTKIKTFFSPYYAVGFSTCVLLIIGSVYVLQPTDTIDSLVTIDGLLADGSIDSYIYENIEEFKTEDIVALLKIEEVADIQEDMIGEESLLTQETKIEKEVQTVKSSMDKALDAVKVDDLLDDLTEEDLELEDESLF